MNRNNFFDSISEYSERTAVISDNGQRYSYSELIKAADLIADKAAARSLVFIVCENCFEAIAGYIGFLRKRAVPVLVNKKTDAEMLGLLCEKYKPQFIFCENGWYNSQNAALSFMNYSLYETEYSEIAPKNDDLAVLITTSGSTGSPKLVMQSYDNIISNARSIAEYLGIREDDRAITTMPMSYTFGLSIIQSHLLMGASVIATEKTLMDKAFWTLLKEEQATTFGGVPYIYQMLKRLRFGRMELPSLRYITQAGGKLSKELIEEFVGVCSAKNIEFIVMYGQTEATARMSYVPWDRAAEKAGSVGIAIPGGKLKVIDNDGNEISEPEKVGELVYEGDNVTLGYALCSEDLNSSDSRHGILYTGDMAKFDSDGFFYIVGRKKRFLKIFGNRVNLDETEGLLNGAGFNCVCSGVDDCLKIYIVDADDEIKKKAVDFISEKTGLNRSAFKIFSIPEIPRNDSGKVIYTALEEYK